jgi:hypothetical protein
MIGTVDVQLTYSFNGLHFQRGLRTPLIGLNDLGLPGSAMIYPTSMIEAGDELRIYSAGSKHLHFGYPAKSNPHRKGEIPATAILLHTIRKDGFMYLRSRGNWGTLTTKGFVLGNRALRVNAQAPYGELRFQIAGLDGRPLEGFTFDECVPFREQDAILHSMRWKEKDLAEVLGKPVRLQLLLRNTRLYAIRGDMHFLDLREVAMIQDGKAIDTSRLSF